MAGLGAAALAAILAGVIWSSWPASPPSMAPATAQPPSLAAQRLYLAGMDDWSRRTPDSLHRAVEEFTQAIRLSPGYAEAYVGLANCYNLLREFTLMPAAQAYPLAAAAARHALALNGRLSSAHVALAFVESYWDWDLAAARREYERAIALDPNSELNHHWFATFLSARGEGERSLEEFRKARALNPSSLAINSDYGLVLYETGHKAEGVATLQATEKTDPKFLSPHRYLASIYLQEGRNEDFLREAETAADLTDDRHLMETIEAARAGLAKGGRKGLLDALLSEKLRQYKFGAVTAYSVADTYALIGDADAALTYLQISIDRHEEDASEVGGDPAFAPMRGTTRYQLLISKIRPSGDGPRRS
jgi:Tfp pilus assembly protein PilF